jgi:hypothetical protein
VGQLGWPLAAPEIRPWPRIYIRGLPTNRQLGLVNTSPLVVTHAY